MKMKWKKERVMRAILNEREKQEKKKNRSTDWIVKENTKNS